LTCEYLRDFSKKFEITLILDSGAWGKMIHEKTTAKYLVTLSLSDQILVVASTIYASDGTRM
jgi:hypothetical protein